MAGATGRRRAVEFVIGLTLLTLFANMAPTQPTPQQRTQWGKEARRLELEGATLFSQSLHWEATEKLRQALELRRRQYPAELYPKGHANLALSMTVLALLLRESGAYEQSRSQHEEALALYRNLYPPSTHPQGHVNLVASLTGLGQLLQDAGAYDKSREYFEQSLAMLQKLYPADRFPNGDPFLAVGYSNVGFVLMQMKRHEQARPYLEQALTIFQKQFPPSTHPDGDPLLATSLANLGRLLLEARLYREALPYFEKALRMRERLYPSERLPDGHVDLVGSSTSMAVVLCALQRREEARPYLERALAMARQLYPESKYPNGHSVVAMRLLDQGLYWLQAGQAKLGRRPLEEAVAMLRALYPAQRFPMGHPDLVTALNGLGILLHTEGKNETARWKLLESLAMSRGLLDREIGLASEADALALAGSQTLMRDVYLSVTRGRAETAAEAYQIVWDTKAAVTRVLEARHAAARAGAAGQAERLAQLRDVRRQSERLLQSTRLDPVERDRQLAAMARKRDELERDLAKSLPAMHLGIQRGRSSPEELITRLPSGAAFVDLLSYLRFGGETPDSKSVFGQYTPGYVAFVLAPGEEVRRVELGDAQPIQAAVKAWRDAIDQRRSSPAAASLRDLVWNKVAPHLPAKTRTLYIGPDGDLARIPWTALPGGQNDRVLLDDFPGGVAMAPHGSFLLEHLKATAPSSIPEKALLVGGLDYGQSPWAPLPGTSAEIGALARLAATTPTQLTGDRVNLFRLARELTRDRYAHLATHGFFDQDAVNAERRRTRDAMKNWQFGGDNLRAFAVQNPLGSVGLVLSGGEVVTGLSIVDLPLDNLKLVTLSACETGLGEYTGGEGVQGLQRAFHLAGCPNVVASLWKVNDAATAALMAKFYHELWVNKKPPIEALREAQLTIYRHPELIPDLAGERGAPRLKEAVAIQASGAASARRERAETKLWAAFVLSGVGR